MAMSPPFPWDDPLKKTTQDYRETEGSKPKKQLGCNKLLKGEMLPPNDLFLQTGEPCTTCAALQRGTNIKPGISWCSLSPSEQNSS